MYLLHHFYCVFTYIHPLPIKKDLYECQNISVNYLYALLYVFFIRRPLHFFGKSFPRVLHNLPPNTNQNTCRHLELAFNSFYPPDIDLVLISDNSLPLFPSFSPSLLYLFLLLTALTQNCHMAPSLLCLPINKDLHKCRNVSVKFLCVYLCLSSENFFIFSSFPFLFPFLCYLYFCTFHFLLYHILFFLTRILSDPLLWASLIKLFPHGKKTLIII